MNEKNQLELEKTLEKIEADYVICLKELNKSRREATIKAYEKANVPLPQRWKPRPIPAGVPPLPKPKKGKIRWF